MVEYRKRSFSPFRFSTSIQFDAFAFFFFFIGQRTKGSRIGERQREKKRKRFIEEDMCGFEKGGRLLSGDPSMDWFLGGLTAFDFVRWVVS